MRTDDFLADLERQLASARPRRRPPAATWLAVPAVAAVLVLAFLAGGDPDSEREARPATTGEPVRLENRSGDPEVGRQARDRLEAAGYDVTLRELPGVPETAIFAPEPEAEGLADALGLEAPESARGWTAYAPLEEGPIRVVLGKNELGAGAKPVDVRDASGDPAAAELAERLLRADGLLIGVSSGGGETVPETTISGDDVELMERARRALELPVDAMRFVEAGGVSIVLGKDYAGPAPPQVLRRPTHVLLRNGSSRDSAEAQAGRLLVEAGFEVAVEASELDPRERSQVDFSGDHLNEAQAVADALGIERVVRVYGADLPEVVVTLGDDFAG